jgi:hypothetical protein
MRRLLTIVAMVLFVAQISLAQTHESAAATSEAEIASPQAAHATADSRPVLDDDAYWAPIVFILIGMMFLSAAVIGPIVRLNMPEELPPPAHSHDEPPGTSHHHGASGTLNPAPEAELHDNHH